MPYLWFGGGLGRFRTKYLSAFIFLWQNCLSLTNVKVFLGYSMKHVLTTNQSINQYEGFDGRLYEGSE